MKAQTIDQVIVQLDEIIHESKENNSRLGYFAALYRKVTIEVKKGIEKDQFDGGARMEKLDVIFANRYIEAFEQHKNNANPTQSWKLAFDAASSWSPTVLQHLLAGMNAHIHLDLGIAAAQSIENRDLSALRGDFDKINQILASLLNEVQQDLAEVWPLLKVFDLAAGDLDETLSRFGIEMARGRAWRVAEDIVTRESTDADARIIELDQETYQVGKMILAPGKLLRLILLLVRLGELGTVQKTIAILED